MDVVALHLGTDHLWYLPEILAAAVILFIGVTGIRTKLERMNENYKREQERKESDADGKRND
jgi:putative Mn2+ efflux pump MntP